ncbi:HemK2/MTQ2 family protein methyltransferase [Rhodococcus koreensis]|uniref:Release factor glutamine methyltransferase n=1 Tax=Rhodococcus koreensis TaxID=99653 RepID=A0A1H4LCX8_9NOCA|nr:HemK2/MTQ2 family protein methyltransferase [Rhodococcus koreensis]SEB68574.1 release factor glutamine methyltransferase [Rhodococcus koreensis]
MLLRIPGVYPPQDDTRLLADALAEQPFDARTRVLDICTGTGALALRVAELGAGTVTAIAISRRAVLTARLNARIRGCTIRVLQGNLTAPVRGEHFDLVISNPPYVPYVPAEDDRIPGIGMARAWDAGTDGRALLDRICAQAPDVLAPGGTLLLAQSALSGVGKTQVMLEEQGLQVDVVARREIPFGPVLTGRRRMLAARGIITAGQRNEEIVVIRGRQHA